jgi:hypothetical protein
MKHAHRDKELKDRTPDRRSRSRTVARTNPDKDIRDDRHMSGRPETSRVSSVRAAARNGQKGLNTGSVYSLHREANAGRSLEHVPLRAVV